MTTITVYKSDANNKYDRLSAELLDLDPDCERAKEIRRQQANMERLSPELRKRLILEMAARLHLPATKEDAD